MSQDGSEISGLLWDKTQQGSAKVRYRSRKRDFGLASKIAHVDTWFSCMFIHRALVAWSTPLKPIRLSKLPDLTTHECILVCQEMGVNLGVARGVRIHKNKRCCYILIGEYPHVSKRSLIHCVHAAHKTDIDVEQIGDRGSMHCLIDEADNPTLDLADARSSIDTSDTGLNALLVPKDHHINGSTLKEPLIVGEEHICEAPFLHHTSEYGRGTGLFKEIGRDDKDELAARCQ